MEMPERVARAICRAAYRHVPDGEVLDQIIEMTWSKWEPHAEAAVAVLREPADA